MLCDQGTPEKVWLEGEKELGACTGQEKGEGEEDEESEQNFWSDHKFMADIDNITEGPGFNVRVTGRPQILTRPQ